MKAKIRNLIRTRTEARAQASRTNGAKSRGPVTPAGKRIAARNAEKHGILSDILVDGEDISRFNALLARLVHEHKPKTETDYDMIETLAAARWRHMRIWGIEAECITAEIRSLVAASPELAQQKPSARAAAAWRRMADESNALQITRRYESAYYREYLHALKYLQKRDSQTENYETNPREDQALLIERFGELFAPAPPEPAQPVSPEPEIIGCA